MTANSKHPNIKDVPASQHGHMTLDQTAIDAARRSLDQGAVTPSYGPWRKDIINLLNDSLATELVCVLRYKRHHFAANVGIAEDRRRAEGLACRLKFFAIKQKHPKELKNPLPH